MNSTGRTHRLSYLFIIAAGSLFTTGCAALGPQPAMSSMPERTLAEQMAQVQQWSGTPKNATSSTDHAVDRPKLKEMKSYDKTVAILNFDAEAGISKGEAKVLADRYFVELDKMKAFKLVNRAKMASVLEMQKFSRSENCSASECAVEAGQMLSVAYMVYGSIARIGETYTLNTYLVNVETGATEASATFDYRGTIDDFLTKGMCNNVALLLNSASGKQ